MNIEEVLTSTGSGVDTVSVFFYILVSSCIIVIAYLILSPLLKKGRRRSEPTEDKGRVKKLKDSKEFVQIEDIRDNMYIMKDGRKFVASMSCSGYDYYIAEESERNQTMEGYMGFVNTISEQICMRADSSAVDLTYSIRRYRNVLEEKYREYGELSDRRNQLEESLASDGGDAGGLSEELEEISRRLTVLSNQILHIENVIEYQEELSGLTDHPVREERYIFSWEYNPIDFVSDPTEEEIYDRARKELDSKYSQMASALANCGVTCHRDTDEDLYRLAYRYYHPNGADRFCNDVGNHRNRIVSGRASIEEMREQYQKSILQDVQKSIEELQKKTAEYDAWEEEWAYEETQEEG